MEVVNGRYELLAVVGRGGQAVVYRALDRTRQTIVAVKQIDTRRGHSMDALEREVQILRSLNHPNIVQYLDEVRTAEHVYVVIEFADSGSLLAIQKQAPGGRQLPERQVAGYVAQVMAGLRYLHERGVLHRDIKAANVLLARGGVVKLSDFGLSYLLGPQGGGAGDADDLGSSGHSTPTPSDAPTSVVGSVYWMAPEVIRGERVTDAADIWSVGCLAIELLTGNPPFYDRPPANALYSIAEVTAVELPPNVSPEARDFLEHCLRPVAGERWAASKLEGHRWLQPLTPVSDGAGSSTTTAPVAQGTPVTAQGTGTAGAELAHASSSVAADGGVGGSASSGKGAGSTNPYADRTTSAGTAHSMFDDGPTAGIAGTNGGAGGSHFPSAGTLSTSGPAAGGSSSTAAAGDAALVESRLFSESQREAWLRSEGLGPTVANLALVPAETAFRIVRAFAFAAEQLGGDQPRAAGPDGAPNTYFFAALGATPFWDLALGVIAAPDSIATLFAQLCYHQPCDAAQFAPAHAGALRSVLLGDEAALCIDALFELVVGRDAPLCGANPMTAATAHNGPQTTTRARDGAVTGAAAGASRRRPPITAERRERAIARMLRDGARATVIDAVETIANGAFRSQHEPACGWAPLDKLFHVLRALLDGPALDPSLITDRWLVAVQEGANHRCLGAVLLLGRLAAELPAVAARPLGIGTLLNVITDSRSDASLRRAAAECLPQLQVGAGIAFLEDRQTTVPLLALAANNTPLHTEDFVTPMLVALCERRPSMAAACASYPRMLPIAVAKLHRGLGSKNPAEMRAAIKLVALLFASSEQPTQFCTSADLLRTLATTIQKYTDVFPRDVVKAAEELFSGLGAQASLM